MTGVMQSFNMHTLEVWLALTCLLACSSIVSACQCKCYEHRCNCTSTVVPGPVAGLKNSTTSLNFTLIDHQLIDHQLIDLEDLHLARFTNLSVLRIGVDYNRRDTAFGTLDGLDNATTFTGLRNLRILQLNIFAPAGITIHPCIFAPLPLLEELDLSLTQTLGLSKLQHTFQNMTTKTLKVLKLRSVQSYVDSHAFTTELNVTTFFKPFEDMALEVVDISRNALTHISPGLFRHHFLKEVYFSENFVSMTGVFF